MTRADRRRAAKAHKPPFALLPWVSLRVVALVMKAGAEKYAPHDWRRGASWSMYWSAILRHLTAWYEGEDLDPESGLSHLAHACASILILLHYALTQTGDDDRPCSTYPKASSRTPTQSPRSR
jgi:hypothetical protein